MTVYAYRGIDAAGKKVRGVRDADNPKLLKDVLRREGVFTTEVAEKADGAQSNAISDMITRFRGVSLTQLALVTKQLAVLLRSGIPLVEALSALIDNLGKTELKDVFADIRNEVNEGSSMARAMKKHPRAFTDIYVNMVEAGEASGTLEIVLERLAEFLDSQSNVRSKITSAMAYPILMLIVIVIVLFIMMTVVVPKVTAIFESFQQSLPWYTRLLIFVSDIVSGYWWLILTIVGLGIYFFRRWKNTEEGHLKWDTFLLRLPVLGSVITMLSVSRFARTLATLLASGVPVLKSMDITKNVFGNYALRNTIDHVQSSVREGESIAQPLKDAQLFPPLVTHMIAVGERSGQLEEMLNHVANSYDRELDNEITKLTSLFEPILIIVMGGTVAFIAFSILMPLLQINELAQ